MLDPAITKLAHDIAYTSKRLSTEESDQLLKITPGLANYAITTLLLTLIKDHEESYATYNAVLGILEAVKQEFYRVHVAPYENQKRFENGDVAALAQI